MLIVIPTYKRNDCLKWVLQSLIQCRTSNIPEQIRVVVVNNYPPAASEIAEIVDHYKRDQRFFWEILYRKKSLIPADNWYSAIFEKALEDEVVFINSDDDLFTPESLEIRYQEIIRNDGDLLLSKLGPTVFFHEKAERILVLNEQPKTTLQVSMRLEIDTLEAYDPQHLSNHCYRNTARLKQFFNKAMGWCDELYWLDENNRTIFLPLIFSFAIIISGGKVIGVPTPLIIRGQEIEEVRNAPYGVPSWNHGFIHLCALIIMNNKDLLGNKGLDNLRKNYHSTYVSWFLTYIFDRRLGWRVIIDTQRHAGFKWHSLMSMKILKGVRLIVVDWMGLRAYRVKKMVMSESVKTSTFMKKLNAG
jgi:glycosyltransferase involved in cell wall biosynthesis